MKTALLFPGQGAQFEGMCRDLYEGYPSVKELLEGARSFLPGGKLPFELSEAELKETRFTQCAIFLHSAAVLTALGKTDFDSISGFSLGECSALWASGMLSFEDTISLIAVRSALMDEAARKNPGKMYAIVGGDADTPGLIEKFCHDAQSLGYVAPVNFNCPGQTVIAGSVEAADSVASACKDNSLRAMPLKTSGAFHCSFMKEASDAFYEKLQSFTFKKPDCRVYSNLTGKLYNDEIISDMPLYLARHIVNPVRFSSIISNMLADGVTRFIEIGCGKTLTGFVRRTDRAAETYITTEKADIEALKSAQN